MGKNSTLELTQLLSEIRQCKLCQGKIPEPNPVVQARLTASILIIGQAPGSKVHASGIPWQDASGDRLRAWMNIDEESFYDDSLVAIVPMGFCYPGKAKSGDLPPRRECAKQWHAPLLDKLKNIRCTLLIGSYAQAHYATSNHASMTARVKNWKDEAPNTFMLPHPSPRNQAWFKNNPWFLKETVPDLQQQINCILQERSI